MKRFSIAVVTVLALAASAAPARAQDAARARVLDLTFESDGRVSLSAQNVTVREILVEWARQCGCYIVNAEKLPGGPLMVPLLFPHESQEKVLESLLRQAAGFVLTPQRAGSASRSDFETIYILASSSSIAGGFTPATYTPVSAPLPTPGSPDDELPAVSPMMPPGMTQNMPTPGGVPPPGAPGGVPMPMAPGQPSPGGMPSATPTPNTRVPGTPGTFVPIVPISTSPSSSPAPGAVPPATPQGR